MLEAAKKAKTLEAVMSIAGQEFIEKGLGCITGKTRIEYVADAIRAWYMDQGYIKPASYEVAVYCDRCEKDFTVKI